MEQILVCACVCIPQSVPSGTQTDSSGFISNMLIKPGQYGWVWVGLRLPVNIIVTRLKAGNFRLENIIH